MSISDGRIDSYPSWRAAEGEPASAANFGTSVSGQLFPVGVQRLAVERGEQFRELSPDNDDIWLHAIAVEQGIRVRLVDGRSTMFPFLPGTQQGGLYLTNYWEGANDRQIAAELSPGPARRPVRGDHARPALDVGALQSLDGGAEVGRRDVRRRCAGVPVGPTQVGKIQGLIGGDVGGHRAGQLRSVQFIQEPRT